MVMFLSAEWGSTKTGEQEQLTVTALNCVLRVPRYIPQEQRFDVRVLVRQTDHNKMIVVKIYSTDLLLCACVLFFVLLLCIPGSGSPN